MLGFLSGLSIIWRLVAIGGIVLSVTGGLYFIYDGIRDKGYSACEMEHREAAIKLKDESRRKILDLEKRYETRIEELLSVDAPDSGVGAYVTRALDGLQ